MKRILAKELRAGMLIYGVEGDGMWNGIDVKRRIGWVVKEDYKPASARIKVEHPKLGPTAGYIGYGDDWVDIESQTPDPDPDHPEWGEACW